MGQEDMKNFCEKKIEHKGESAADQEIDLYSNVPLDLDDQKEKESCAEKIAGHGHDPDI